MAVTIVSNIEEWSFLPVSNPINITVSSNNTGKCNFRYVCDVYVDDVNVFRFKLSPDPTTGWAFFQVSDVLNDYLIQNVDRVDSATIYSASTEEAKTVIKVQLKFGEEYDNSTDCSQPVVVWSDLASSNIFWVYYGAFDYEEWPEYIWSDWVVDFTTKPTKFLTKVPRGSVESSFADSYFLDFLSSIPLLNANSLLRIVVTNTDTAPYTLDIPIVSNFSSTVKRYRIACGVAQINRYAENLFPFLIFSRPLISTSTTHYTVGLVNLPTDEYITEVFTIRVSKPTERRKRIGFINSLGSIDYITFFNRDRTQFNIERRNFKQYLTSKKGTKWSYDVGDRQSTTYAVTAKEEHIVSTFVSKKTSEYLYEMWLSTDVWIEDRPRTMSFRVFKDIFGSFVNPEPDPEKRSPLMIFYLEEDHGFKPGDKFFSYSWDNPDFNALFTVQNVSGRFIDVGASSNVFNLDDTKISTTSNKIGYSACGFLVKYEDSRRIPILLEDNNIEVKQKLDKPIEYTLTYSNSVDKITLRS